MKTIIAVYASVLLCACQSRSAPAEADSHIFPLALSQAVGSGDVQAVIQFVPGLETLRVSDPSTYFRLASPTARTLGSAYDNPAAKRAFLRLFDHLVETPCPADNAQAAPCYTARSDIALYGLNFDDVRKDKDRLIAIARFEGEVRSRRILNYATRGTAQPGLLILLQVGVKDASSLTNPELRAAYEKAKKDNQQDLTMNNLQYALSRSSVAFVLLHNCAQFFPSSDPQNADFFNAIATAAHLTEDERRQF
jgi:hypothetical protein